MRIDLNQPLGPITVREARNLLRRHRHADPLWLGDIAQFLCLTATADAVAAADAMVDAGFLAPVGDCPPAGLPADAAALSRSAHPYDYILTAMANSLCLAKGAKPVKRATAERALAGLLERAAEINDDPWWLYWVRRVVVFGSFLDQDRLDYGDVDVAVELLPRHQGDHQIEAERHRRREAALRGIYIGSRLVDEIGFVTLLAHRHLKNRSRVLSLHGFGDRAIWAGDHETVYEAPRDLTIDGPAALVGLPDDHAPESCPWCDRAPVLRTVPHPAVPFRTPLPPIRWGCTTCHLLFSEESFELSWARSALLRKLTTDAEACGWCGRAAIPSVAGLRGCEVCFALALPPESLGDHNLAEAAFAEALGVVGKVLEGSARHPLHEAQPFEESV